MAGKKRAPAKKSTNWGGKRKGSGRSSKEKPDYDADFRKYCGDAIASIEKENGKTIAEAVFGMIFDKDIQDTVKVSIWNKFCDINTISKTESDIKVEKHEGPKVYLPEMRPDPALKVMEGGKK